MTVIYLDNNASTKVDPLVAQAMKTYTEGEVFGNPHSGHFLGALSRDAINKARNQVLTIFGIDAGWKCVFTSGASESNNLAIKGFVLQRMRLARTGTVHIVTSTVEHGSVDKCIDWLISLFDSVTVTELPLDSHGVIDLVAADRILRDGRSVALCSCIHTVAETGAVQPIHELGALVKSIWPTALFHTDASQSVGKLGGDILATLPHYADMITVAGHKFGAPKGIGALLVKDDTVSRIDPLIHGAGQEFGIRGGTENVACIVGLGYACELSNTCTKSRHLVDELWRILSSKFDEVGLDYHLNSTAPVRSPYTLNFSVAGLNGPGVVGQLGNENLYGLKICFSAGSACHSRGCPTPSKVLAAMGLEAKYSTSGIRLSVAGQTSVEDIRTAAPLIARSILESLQGCK